MRLVIYCAKRICLSIFCKLVPLIVYNRESSLLTGSPICLRTWNWHLRQAWS